MKKSADAKRVVAKNKQPSYLIVVGASAGGLDAMNDFFHHYSPYINNASIIIAQHVSPTYKSRLLHLLSSKTQITVSEAKNGLKISTNHIYITPNNCDISVTKEKTIKLVKPVTDKEAKPSIDRLLISVSDVYKRKSIAVILSGTGHDGTQGVLAIHKAGGFVIAQNPQSIQFNSMPMAAIETGKVNQVLLTTEMGAAIINHIKNPKAKKETTGLIIGNDPWQEIFKLLSVHKNADFSRYKHPTLQRRLAKRLGLLKIKTPALYLNYLKGNPKELDELFSIFLISVTEFFRDKDSFKALQNNVTKLVKKKKKGDSIRIWSIACATGEEAYSIAILLREILKEKINDFKIQIFATDIEEKVLTIARQGIYDERAMKNIPLKLLKEYFIKTDKGYKVTKEVRSMVLFSKHDVTLSPPFIKMDVISCRNLLIYLNQSLHRKLFPLFHYALLPHGILFLGKSETIRSFSDLFSTVDSRHKIFHRKKNGSNHYLKFPPYYGYQMGKQALAYSRNVVKPAFNEQIKETLLQTYEHPFVVINEKYELQEINGNMQQYFTIKQGAFHNSLLKIVNSDLQMMLRTTLFKCLKDQKPIKSAIRKIIVAKKQRFMRLSARPIIGNYEGTKLYLIIFEQVTPEELIFNTDGTKKKSGKRISELEHELEAAGQQLQVYISELELVNKEQQSLNEELQTVNEDLQFTNEELETANEELQSTSEEIQISNNELKEANQELERKEAETIAKHKTIEFQAYLLNSVEQAIMASDLDGNISYWNRFAEKLYGWKQAEIVGRSRFILRAIESDEIKENKNIIDILIQGRGTSRESLGKTKEGKIFPVYTLLSPLYNEQEDVVGLISVSYDLSNQKKAEFERANKEALINANNSFIWSINKNYELLTANEAFQKELRTKANRKIEDGENIFWITDLPEYQEQNLSGIFHHAFENNSSSTEYKSAESGKWRELTVNPIINHEEVVGLACYDRDITHQKEIELLQRALTEQVKQKADALQLSNTELERFAFIASHDLQEPLRMVTSFLTLLAERFKDTDDPKAHQYIKYAVDGARRMKQFILDLLEYSRVNSNTDALGETDMNEVMREVVKVFRLIIKERNASIIVNQLPVVARTRHAQLNQLMQNLIGNALKYNTSAVPEITVNAKEDDHSWIFAIKDNGIGFESAFSQKIFDVFQRLHSQSEYPGTGIGLSICEKIVVRHGGKIWAESTKGVGSTFYFSLPK